MVATEPRTATNPVRRQLLAVAAATFAGLLLLAGPASAQDYPPRAMISVTNPGASVTIESPNADWGPGTTVRITYTTPTGTRVVETATVEEDGTFATQISIPENADPGVKEVQVSGTGEDGHQQHWEPRVLVQEESAGAGDSSGEDASAGTGDPQTQTTGDEAQGADAPAPAGEAQGTDASAQGDSERQAPGPAAKTEAQAATAGLGADSGSPTAAWVLGALVLVSVGAAATVFAARRREE